jgi:alkylated DNA repair dioxygenase AlkB
MAKANVYYMQIAATRKRTDRQRPSAARVEANVPGLTYVPRFLSAALESFLLARVDAEAWQQDLRRRTQHYGYHYDYKARRVDASMYLGSLPSRAQSLAMRLVSEGFMERLPDQLIVNEYLPGQGITPHIDSVQCFGPTICSISLGSGCLMDFAEKSGERTASLLLERGSLLVLRADARYGWKHSIANRKRDTVAGNTFTRGRRVSLTFRTVAG